VAEKPDYRGMTVNERLFAAGKLEAFDAAIRTRDRQGAMALLQALDIELAERTVDAILTDPARYGRLNPP